MNSLVLQLQQEALDRTVPVSDLLRKALVVARKLSLSDLGGWIESELNGYHGKAEVPEYRTVQGQVRAWNPYRGWIPVMFGNPNEGDVYSRRKCNQSIAELEHLVNDKSEGTLHMPFPPAALQQLARRMDFSTEVSLFTASVSLVGIIDAVRTIILNWTLTLEAAGILGEGLAFTREEKHAAVSSPQSITNFYGPVQGTQIQQNSPSSVQVYSSSPIEPAAVRAFLDEFRQHRDSLDLSTEARSEIEAEVKSAEAQLASPKPKASILGECLRSVRTILERAGGTVAGKLLLDALGKLI